MNIDLESMSVEELEKLIKDAESKKRQKQSSDFLKRLFKNEDFLTNLLKSHQIKNFIKSRGYDLNEEDIVKVALPKYSEIFKGE